MNIIEEIILAIIRKSRYIKNCTIISKTRDMFLILWHFPKQMGTGQCCKKINTIHLKSRKIVIQDPSKKTGQHLKEWLLK